MFYPRVEWTKKEATINVHGKDKMHKRFFLCMVEREGTWTSIPFCRSQSPSKHHTKKMQGVMEFASPKLPCLCSLPIHVPEPTDRTGGTLQSKVSCQMSWSLNQKQISVSKGHTPHLPQGSHTSTSISKVTSKSFKAARSPRPWWALEGWQCLLHLLVVPRYWWGKKGVVTLVGRPMA